MSKKRSRSSVFGAVQELDSQDARAEQRKRTTSQKEIARSKAARSQIKLNGHLMECRILLQRADEELASQDGDSCNQLLANLLWARAQLQGQAASDKDYTEIVKSKEKLHETLQSEYENCRKEWQEVLNRRHKDLRLHSGLTAKTQFKVMDANFWETVDATVAHERLRQGVDTDFDDAKIYQHMLQDFLRERTGTGQDGSLVAEQRLKAAAQSSSKKKNVDRRASKGRKIRYVAIPKLVNFTFPVARPQTVTGMDEDEWFKTLFGGAGARNQTK